MKLTNAELDQARAWIRNGDIQSLEQWFDKRGIIVSRKTLHDSIGMAIKRDPKLAIRLFDDVFIGADPELDRIAYLSKCVASLVAIVVVFCGCLGGVIYIVRAIW